METATQRLIRLASALNPTGEIGDGMVAQLNEAARAAQAEQPISDPRKLELPGGTYSDER